MAGAQCDMCQGEPAVMSQMNLENYDTVQIGRDCLLPFLVSLVEQITGMPMGPAAPDGGQDAADGQDAAPAAAGGGQDGQDGTSGQDGTPAAGAAAAQPKRAARKRARPAADGQAAGGTP